MAVVYILSGKVAVDEVPNEFVDEKTSKAKTAENVKEVLKKEPQIEGEYAEALEVAKEAALRAGELILEVYESDDFEVETKDDDSPLTKADRLANDKIVEMLREKFPTYAILSEEEEDNTERLSNPYCFVVDPLDGTKEFIKRNGEFTVNIALAKDHKSVMGVIYIPVTDELFYAAEGQGAFYRDKDGNTKKMKVSSRLYSFRDRKNFRAVSSRSHESEEMKALFDKYSIDNVVRIGSSIKGCLVARGDAEVYYRYGLTKEWDTAAMQCIVEEAGGVFRQMDDTEMRYNRENTLNEKGFYVLNKKENRLI
ncbi:MAG: 3'(2'),5'-bisphosphate nucleotidase CysQ [Eubacterium sp.]|nr:3'(2'),5'-bisphosphate nucleotidase CysQ [Eubacterium sp.]